MIFVALSTSLLLYTAPVKLTVTASPLSNPLPVVAVTLNPLGAFVFPSYAFVIGLYVKLATVNVFLSTVAVVFVDASVISFESAGAFQFVPAPTFAIT